MTACCVQGRTPYECADLDIGTFSDALFYRLNVIHIDMMHHDEAGVQADSEDKPAMTGL